MKLLLHKSTQRHIDGIIANPGGSFLFHGPSNMGKTLAALEVARQLNCDNCADESCKSCLMLKAGMHPDIELMGQDDKNKIGIEAVQNLIKKLKYSAYDPSSHRVVIIDNAETLTLPAQNALLKVLEEPPVSTTFILTAVSPVSILETIVSRCQPVYFGPLSTDELLSLDGLKSLPRDDAEKIIEAGAHKPGEIISNLKNEETGDSLDLAEHMITSNDLFAKLKISTTVAKHPDKIGSFVDILESLAKKRAREGDNPASIIAVDRLRKRLSTNINPKSALEAFAVETAC